MTKLLLQSTAASIVAGPFLDAASGLESKEAFTSLSGVMYKTNGASTVITGVAASHTASGMYKIPLSTGSVDTLGRLRFHFANSACHLPVWEDFTVLPANSYNSFVANTDDFDVTIIDITASAINASALAANALHAAAIASSTFSNAKFANNFLTAGLIGASAFSNAKFANNFLTDGLIGASALSNAKFVNNFLTNSLVADGLITSGKIGASSLLSTQIADSFGQRLADHTLRRSGSGVENSSFGDGLHFRSLYGAAAKQVNRVDASSGTAASIFQTDDVTSLGSQTISACDNASPIVQLNTD